MQILTCVSHPVMQAMLDKHERLVHHKERPFSCHLCNKKFGQKVHLDVHISGVHLKERPYGNDLCLFLYDL